MTQEIVPRLWGLAHATASEPTATALGDASENTSPRALAARDGAGQTDSGQFPGLLVASLTDGGRAYQPVHSLASAALSSAARFLNLPCL